MNISQVLLKTIHVLATEQVNSTLEIDNSISIIGQEKFCAMVPKRHKRMSSCGGVVGADEPIQMGLSSQKSSCGFADGSKRGSGQRP